MNIQSYVVTAFAAVLRVDAVYRMSVDSRQAHYAQLQQHQVAADIITAVGHSLDSQLTA